jgi:hypothetical protein
VISRHSNVYIKIPEGNVNSPVPKTACFASLLHHYKLPFLDGRNTYNLFPSFEQFIARTTTILSVIDIIPPIDRESEFFTFIGG